MLAFVMGLVENDPAVHAALWLLMIGGPPSHGATVRKVTVRIIGAVLAGIITVVGIGIVSSNFGSAPAYMAVIFAGAMIMAYIEEGGGILSYMGIGATVFLIAFSGVRPRDNVFASLWTVWGIILGMITRAIVSIVWREDARRTLVEEFASPISGLLGLLPDAQGNWPDLQRIYDGEAKIVNGLGELLEVANDAKLEGRTAGIDSANLIEALDILRRLAVLAGNTALAEIGAATTAADNLPAARKALMSAIGMRLQVWRDFLDQRRRDRELNPAPLREMVTRAATNTADMHSAIARLGDRASQAGQSATYLRLATLFRDLENSLTGISLSPR
ncbi:MAG: hypothetical protein ACREP6_02640 [Candidatus Binataceae bacterium]